MAASRILRVLLAAIALLAISTPNIAHALPYMAQIAGTPCITCHVNQQGGGMRTEIGWGSMAYSGALQYEQIGLDWVSERESNEVIDDIMALGLDARWQAARVGAPSITLSDAGVPEAELAPWDVFTMQLQPYLSVEAHEMLTIYGTYNMGQGTFEDGEACWTPYAGQSCFEAMAIFEPAANLPSLRAGMIQPSIGIRHDDHTMLIRQDVSQARAPIIAPNYAELGAEVRYQPTYWFSTEVGAYSASNLEDAVGEPAMGEDGVASWNARVTFFPQFGRLPRARFTGLFGASTYNAAKFGTDNVFAGIGWLNRGSILLEGAQFRYADRVDRSARSLSVLTTARAFDWLFAQVRVEQGHAETSEGNDDTLAVVGGLQFFPLPYIELRPEYRWERTDTYESGQYSVQLHLFY